MLKDEKRKVFVHQIVAMDQQFGIGNSNLGSELPWKLPREFQTFIEKATRMEPNYAKVAWVMGRKTFEKETREDGGLFSQLLFSVPIVKIVVSTSWKEIPSQLRNDSTYLCQSWQEVMTLIDSMRHDISAAWNIGGQEIYKLQLSQQKNSLKGVRIYLTQIEGKFDCDYFYPKVDFESMRIAEEDDYHGKKDEENGTRYSYHVYEFQ